MGCKLVLSFNSNDGGGLETIRLPFIGKDLSSMSYDEIADYVYDAYLKDYENVEDVIMNKIERQKRVSDPVIVRGVINVENIESIGSGWSGKRLLNSVDPKNTFLRGLITELSKRRNLDGVVTFTDAEIINSDGQKVSGVTLLSGDFAKIQIDSTVTDEIHARSTDEEVLTHELIHLAANDAIDNIENGSDAYKTMIQISNAAIKAFENSNAKHTSELSAILSIKNEKERFKEIISYGLSNPYFTKALQSAPPIKRTKTNKSLLDSVKSWLSNLIFGESENTSLMVDAVNFTSKIVDLNNITVEESSLDMTLGKEFDNEVSENKPDEGVVEDASETETGKFSFKIKPHTGNLVIKSSHSGDFKTPVKASVSNKFIGFTPLKSKSSVKNHYEQSIDRVRTFDPTINKLQSGAVIEVDGKTMMLISKNEKKGTYKVLMQDKTIKDIKLSGEPSVLGGFEVVKYNNAEYLVTDNNRIYHIKSGAEFNASEKRDDALAIRAIAKSKSPHNRSNTGSYNQNDVVFVSTNNKGYGSKDSDEKMIKESLLALNSGAVIITDTESFVDSYYDKESKTRVYQNGLSVDDFKKSKLHNKIGEKLLIEALKKEGAVGVVSTVNGQSIQSWRLPKFGSYSITPSPVSYKTTSEKNNINSVVTSKFKTYNITDSFSNAYAINGNDSVKGKSVIDAILNDEIKIFISKDSNRFGSTAVGSTIRFNDKSTGQYVDVEITHNANNVAISKDKFLENSGLSEMVFDKYINKTNDNHVLAFKVITPSTTQNNRSDASLPSKEMIAVKSAAISDFVKSFNKYFSVNVKTVSTEDSKKIFKQGLMYKSPAFVHRDKLNINHELMTDDISSLRVLMFSLMMENNKPLLNSILRHPDVSKVIREYESHPDFKALPASNRAVNILINSKKASKIAEYTFSENQEYNNIEKRINDFARDKFGLNQMPKYGTISDVYNRAGLKIEPNVKPTKANVDLMTDEKRLVGKLKEDGFIKQICNV